MDKDNENKKKKDPVSNERSTTESSSGSAAPKSEGLRLYPVILMFSICNVFGSSKCDYTILSYTKDQIGA